MSPRVSRRTTTHRLDLVVLLVFVVLGYTISLFKYLISSILTKNSGKNRYVLETNGLLRHFQIKKILVNL